MPRPSIGPKVFWADPDFLCQTKKFIYIILKLFLLDQKMISV